MPLPPLLSLNNALQHAVKLYGLAALEAEVLLAHVLQKNRSHLYAWPEQILTLRQQSDFLALAERRRQGEPLAYLTGYREFWSLSFRVTQDTLIPRPETEILVERALALLADLDKARVADLGTGSGAIAAAIASECPQAEILATDISAAALAVASDNFKQLGLSHIEAYQGAWFDALKNRGHYHLIVSNPPYVAEGDPHLQQDGLPWEPNTALTSGADGLQDIRLLIVQAPEYLQPEGWLMLEHGMDQGTAVRELFAHAGYREITTHQDLEARDRLTQGKRPVDDADKRARNSSL